MIRGLLIAFGSLLVVLLFATFINWIDAREYEIPALLVVIVIVGAVMGYNYFGGWW